MTDKCSKGLVITNVHCYSFIIFIFTSSGFIADLFLITTLFFCYNVSIKISTNFVFLPKFSFFFYCHLHFHLQMHFFASRICIDVFRNWYHVVDYFTILFQWVLNVNTKCRVWFALDTHLITVENLLTKISENKSTISEISLLTLLTWYPPISKLTIIMEDQNICLRKKKTL